jgi:hypothetical protein
LPSEKESDHRESDADHAKDHPEPHQRSDADDDAAEAPNELVVMIRRLQREDYVAV